MYGSRQLQLGFLEVPEKCRALATNHHWKMKHKSLTKSKGTQGLDVN